MFGVVHWVDGCPTFPGDAENQVGTVHPMSVSVLKVSDGSPVQGVSVRWTITDDDPDARFVNAPGDGNVIVSTTNASGMASATLEQVAASIGNNTVRMDVLTQGGKTMFTDTMVKDWRSPVLDVTATGPETIGLLTEATYDITVSNDGDFRATNSVLTMSLPAGLKFVSATDGGTVSASAAAQVVTWNLGTIEVDGSESVSVTAQGTTTGAQTGSYRVVSAEGLSDTTTTETTVLPGGLEVTKTGDAEVAIGSQVTYTIEVTGTGTGASTGVRLVDTVPTGMSFVSSDPASTRSGSQVSFSLGTLNPDEDSSVTITLQADQTGSWTNQVTATSAEGATASAEATTQVVQPVLAITKTGPATALLNADFDYTITVTNSGDGTATGATVVDTLPTGLTYVSSSPTGTASGSTVTWNLGNIAPGDSETITLTVRATEGGAKANTVVASSGGNILRPEATASTNILVPGITLEKTGRAAMFVGNQATYTLTATNSGNAPLTGVTITDTIPAGLTYESSSPSGTESGSTVTWDIGSLAVGGNATVTITLEADAEGTVTNSASVSATEGAVADAATLEVRVLAAPGATIQLTDSADPVTEGEEVDFTVTVSNQGRSAMTGVTVNVSIPTAMTVTSTSDDQATVSANGRMVTFELDGSLALDASFSFTITMEANSLPAGQIRVDTVTTATLSYDQFSEPVSIDQGTTVIEA